MTKFAIVGTGIIFKHHANSIAALDNAELVAVCDINEEKAKEYSEKYNVPYVLDYKKLPETVDFDAVILNLPHALHCEATVFFLNAGKHVLIEKPMANTVEECDKMIEAAEKSGKKLAVGHIQRHYPVNKLARKIATSGELGTFVMYTEERCEDYFYEKRPKWFLNKKMAGGGIAMNFAAHAFDKIFTLAGESNVTSVDAMCGNLANDYDVEGHAQIFAKFDNNSSASITLTGYAATGGGVNLYFSKGAMRLATRSAVEINRGDGNGFIPVEADISGPTAFTNQLDAFIKYINGEDADIADGYYGRRIIDAITRAYAKSEEA